MISSLFQALNLDRDRKRKVPYNFYRYCACETGAGLKSLHSSIAHIRIRSLVEPHLETRVSNVLGGEETLVFLPLCFAFFICNFVQATYPGVSVSLSVKREYPGDVIFRILNYPEKHFEN